MVEILIIIIVVVFAFVVNFLYKRKIDMMIDSASKDVVNEIDDARTIDEKPKIFTVNMPHTPIRRDKVLDEGFNDNDIYLWKEIDDNYCLIYIYDAFILEDFRLNGFYEKYRLVSIDEDTGISFSHQTTNYESAKIKAPISGVIEIIQKSVLKKNTIVAKIYKDKNIYYNWKTDEDLKRKEAERKQMKDIAEREHKMYQWKLESEKREKEEIARKIKERYRRRELEKIVRQELIDSGELFGDKPKRPPIPREIVDAVYRRDGGRCVYCGSTENLQIDHIIPFSKGGATTLENLQLLCRKCNIEKSNKIG